MIRAGEFAAPAVAAVVVLTALLGGGFYPLPRMIVGGALVVVWVFAAMGSRGRLDRTEWLLVGVVGWGLVSAIWVHSSPLAAKETLTTWIIAGLLFGICRRGGDDSRRRAVGILVAGAAVVATAVLVEAFSQGLRVGGLFENPNVAAGVLVPVLPLGWWILDRAPRLRWAWTVIVVAGVVGTGSRAGLLAAIVAVGFLLPRGRIRLAGLLGASVMAIGVLAWRFLSQPDVLAWHRVSIWWAVIKIWLTRPLTGVSPGSLVEAAGPERILHPDEIGHYQFVVGYAESTPLAVLVQLGFVGSMLAILAVAAWVSASRRSAALNSPSLVACFVAMAVLGLFHDFLTIDPVLWWWAALAGCVGRGSPSSIEARSGNRTMTLRWPVLTVMVWVTAWGMITPALARSVWQRGDPTTARVVRTLRIEPWLSATPAERVGRLLASSESWSWRQAAEAVHWADVARRTQPGRASRWADVGRVHLQILTDLNGTEHDVNIARSALDRACSLDPHLPWYWLERARLARVVGNPELAVRFARRALSEEPNTVRGWQFLARLETDFGRIEAARAATAEAGERAKLAERGGLSDYERDLVRPAVDREIVLSGDRE